MLIANTAGFYFSYPPTSSRFGLTISKNIQSIVSFCLLGKDKNIGFSIEEVGKRWTWLSLAISGLFFSCLMNERISETRCQAMANNDGCALTANGQRMWGGIERHRERRLVTSLQQNAHPSQRQWLLLRCPSPSSCNKFPNNHTQRSCSFSSYSLWVLLFNQF